MRQDCFSLAQGSKSSYAAGLDLYRSGKARIELRT
jgi:hypothetical protein